MRELILGGQKSGKSRLAEERARAWLAQSVSHRAVLIATGLACDDEMRQRIARHQADRAVRLPQMQCLQEPRELSAALHMASDAQTLVVIDCVTMWLTNLLMPALGLPESEIPIPDTTDLRQLAQAKLAGLREALQQACGPVVLVSNEIGLGVIPLGREVRAFVDALGLVNQALASDCDRVTLMAAGCPLVMKEPR